MVNSLPSTIYEERVEAGLLMVDAAHAEALPHMDALVQALLRPRAQKSFWQKLLGSGPDIKGLYLHGPVGRGKSFLMDMLFDCVPPGIKKRRQHFYQFMRDVQQRLTAARTAGTRDPLALVADQIASEVRLLCFDEMFVKDVADAMILARLFTQLFAKGVVVVATSNIAPDDLYKGGLQRVRFLPFIEALKKHCTTLLIDGGVDHRQARLIGVQAYHSPLGAEATAQLAGVFDRLTAGSPMEAQTLTVEGRNLHLLRTARGVLLTTFDELCRASLGPLDMLDIAACFSTVIMDGVPPLTAEMKNETIRFITLVDALYDRHRQLFIAAAVPLDQLCTTGPLATDFLRTASRITEMGAKDYQDTLIA